MWLIALGIGPVADSLIGIFLSFEQKQMYLKQAIKDQIGFISHN